MKALFLIFHGFEEANGISKKIRYQVKALKECGMDVHTCYLNEENGHKCRMIDNHTLRDYSSGIKGKLRKRFELQSIVKYILQENIQLVYMRSYHNANPFTISMVKQLKRQGVKVVMEIPTYPYDQEYITRRMKLDLLVDRCFRRKLAAQLDGIVTFSDAETIFGGHTIRISNGIDFDAIPQKITRNDTSRELHLIGVAEVHYWHGFDRIIKGMADYYATHPSYKVYFHIVGALTGERERREILPVIAQYKLEPFVILHGQQHGEQLDKIFEQSDFGIGSLARHRSGITTIKTLKNREYAARGLPFIYSETDTDFDDKPYVLKAPANETPVRIQAIVDFYQTQTWDPAGIRQSISHLSWHAQMQKVIGKYQVTSEKKLKIAYCIPSIHCPGGMERVISLKVNYFTKKFGYDIHLILTDGKDKAPYYPLHPSITLHQLDINYDEMDGMPVLRHITGYVKKQKLFKKRLDACLNELKPDITISTLRRDINIINNMTDGSIKLGEIHFNKSNYRELSDKPLPAFLKKWIRSYWMKQLIRKLRKLKRFIVLSYEDAAEWTELNNVTVIHNPLPFFPDRQSDGSRKQVIAAGRYVPQKGFDMLIKAWKIVSEQHPDWTLRIYGDGFREELQKLIDGLGISRSCILEHTVSNIVDKYCESSIFALSSRYEGFGMVLVEAMVCGVPPVSFACPCGPRDIIDDGNDGLLVPKENINKLAEKIGYLISHENIRKEMGQRARIHVERFKIDHIASQWKELFNSLIS